MDWVVTMFVYVKTFVCVSQPHMKPGGSCGKQSGRKAVWFSSNTSYWSQSQVTHQSLNHGWELTSCLSCHLYFPSSPSLLSFTAVFVCSDQLEMDTNKAKETQKPYVSDSHIHTHTLIYWFSFLMTLCWLTCIHRRLKWQSYSYKERKVTNETRTNQSQNIN